MCIVFKVCYDWICCIFIEEENIKEFIFIVGKLNKICLSLVDKKCIYYLLMIFGINRKIF